MALRGPGVGGRGGCRALAWPGRRRGCADPGRAADPDPGDPRARRPRRSRGPRPTPRPVHGVREPPRHPFMAPNGRSNIHNDAYQTDTYRVRGRSATGPSLDPVRARVRLDHFRLAGPDRDRLRRPRPAGPGTDGPAHAPGARRAAAARRATCGGSQPFTDFSGGGYFYLDHRDHAIVSTNDRHVARRRDRARPSVRRDRAYDLSGARSRTGDGIISVLPDWNGRLWFVTRQGVVGTIDRASGAVRTLRAARRGDQQLLRRRRDGRRLHRLRQGALPVRCGAGRRAVDELAAASIRTPASTSPARATPARERRRP